MHEYKNFKKWEAIVVCGITVLNFLRKNIQRASVLKNPGPVSW